MSEHDERRSNVEFLVNVYKNRPDLFDLDQTDALAASAKELDIPFRRDFEKEEIDLIEYPKQLLGGMIEGITALPISPFKTPKSEGEAIAYELGHLSGFIGFVGVGFAGKLLGKAVGSMGQTMVKSALVTNAAEALAGTSRLANFGSAVTKVGEAAGKFKSVPFMVESFVSKNIGVEKAAEAVGNFFGGSLFAEAAVKQAAKLGIASSVSALHQGLIPSLQAGISGAVFGGAFAGIGKLPIFRAETNMNSIAKAVAGSLLQGGMSSMEGAPTATQIKDYLLGAYFGWHSVTPEHYLAAGRFEKMGSTDGWRANKLYVDAPPEIKEKMALLGEKWFKPIETQRGLWKLARMLGLTDAQEAIENEAKENPAVAPPPDAPPVTVGENAGERVKGKSEDFDPNELPLLGRLYRAIGQIFDVKDLSIREYNGIMREVGTGVEEIIARKGTWSEMETYLQERRGKNEINEESWGAMRQYFLSRSAEVKSQDGYLTAEGNLVKYQPDSRGGLYDYNKNRIESVRTPNILDHILKDPDIFLTVRGIVVGGKYRELPNVDFVDNLPGEPVRGRTYMEWRSVFAAAKKQGMYFYANNGDKSQFKFAKYHPSLENAEQVKRLQDLIKGNKEWAKEYRAGEKLLVSKKKVMSKEDYRKAVLSNMFYAEDYLGTSIEKFSTGDFISKALAFNKRQQMLFSDYSPGRADVIGKSHVKIAIVKEFIDSEAYKQLSARQRKRVKKEISDGAWVIRGDIFDILAKGYGLPAGIDAFKPFIVSGSKEFGTLLGKMAGHRASPAMSAIMREAGIESFMPPSAAKQTGFRTINDFAFDGERLVFGGEKLVQYDIPVEDIKVSFGTYDNSAQKLNMGVRLAKQIMDSLTSEQTTAATRTSYQAFLSSIADGLPEANGMLEHYLRYPSDANLKKLIEWDSTGELKSESLFHDLGLQELLDAMVKNQKFREAARMVITRSGEQNVEDGSLDFLDNGSELAAVSEQMRGALRVIRESDGSDAINLKKGVKKMMDAMMTSYFIKKLTSPKITSGGKAVMAPFTMDMWKSVDLRSGLGKGNQRGNFFLGDTHKDTRIFGIGLDGKDRWMTLAEQVEIRNSLEKGPKYSLLSQEEIDMGLTHELPEVFALARNFFLRAGVRFTFDEPPLTQPWAAQMYPDGRVAINMNYAGRSDVYHEVSHLMFAKMKQTEPDVINRLVSEARELPEFKDIMEIATKRVRTLYPELEQLGYPEMHQEEILAHIFGWAAARRPETLSQKFRAFLTRVWAAIRGAFKDVFAGGEPFAFTERANLEGASVKEVFDALINPHQIMDLEIRREFEAADINAEPAVPGFGENNLPDIIGGLPPEETPVPTAITTRPKRAGEKDWTKPRTEMSQAEEKAEQVIRRIATSSEKNPIELMAPNMPTAGRIFFLLPKRGFVPKKFTMAATSGMLMYHPQYGKEMVRVGESVPLTTSFIERLKKIAPHKIINLADPVSKVTNAEREALKLFRERRSLLGLSEHAPAYQIMQEYRDFIEQTFGINVHSVGPGYAGTILESWKLGVELTWDRLFVSPTNLHERGQARHFTKMGEDYGESKTGWINYAKEGNVLITGENQHDVTPDELQLLRYETTGDVMTSTTIPPPDINEVAWSALWETATKIGTAAKFGSAKMALFNSILGRGGSVKQILARFISTPDAKLKSAEEFLGTMEKTLQEGELLQYNSEEVLQSMVGHLERSLEAKIEENNRALKHYQSTWDYAIQDLRELGPPKAGEKDDRIALWRIIRESKKKLKGELSKQYQLRWLDEALATHEAKEQFIREGNDYFIRSFVGLLKYPRTVFMTEPARKKILGEYRREAELTAPHLQQVAMRSLLNQQKRLDPGIQTLLTPTGKAMSEIENTSGNTAEKLAALYDNTYKFEVSKIEGVRLLGTVKFGDHMFYKWDISKYVPQEELRRFSKVAPKDGRARLLEDVKKRLRAIVLRVPMDDISGMQSLEFGGFTGTPGGQILLHGDIMKLLGGADLDIDTAFFYFGLPEGLHDEVFRNRNSQVNYDRAYPKAQEALMRKADLPLMNKFMGMFDPYHRAIVGSEVAKGRNLNLGVSVANKATISFLYSAIRAQQDGDESITTGMFRLHPRADNGELLRVMARAAINMSADVGAVGGMIAPPEIRAMLLHAAFDKIEVKEGDTWVDAVGKTILDPVEGKLVISPELLKFSNQQVWDMKEYANLYDVNNKLWGYNYRDGRKWSQDEIVESARSFLKEADNLSLLNDHPRRGIIKQVAAMEYRDSNILRFGEYIHSLSRNLQDIQRLIQMGEGGQDLYPFLGKDRPAMNVEQMIAQVEAVQSSPYDLRGMKGVKQLAKNSSAYVEWVERIIAAKPNKEKEYQARIRGSAFAPQERYQQETAERFIRSQIELADHMIGSRFQDASSLSALNILYKRSGLPPDEARHMLSDVAGIKTFLKKGADIPFEQIADLIFRGQETAFERGKVLGLDPHDVLDFYNGVLHSSLTAGSETTSVARQNDLVPEHIIRLFNMEYKKLFDISEAKVHRVSVDEYLKQRSAADVVMGNADSPNVKRIIHKTIKWTPEGKEEPQDKEVNDLIRNIYNRLQYYDGVTFEMVLGSLREISKKAQPSDMDLYDLKGLYNVLRKFRTETGVFKEFFGKEHAKESYKAVTRGSVFPFSQTTADDLRRNDLVFFAKEALTEDGSFNENATPLRHWNTDSGLFQTVFATTHTPMSHFGKLIEIKQASEKHVQRAKYLQYNIIDKELAALSSGVTLSGTKEDHAERLMAAAVAEYELMGARAEFDFVVKDEGSSVEDIHKARENVDVYENRYNLQRKYVEEFGKRSFDKLGQQYTGDALITQNKDALTRLSTWFWKERINPGEKWENQNLVWLAPGVLDVTRSFMPMLRLNSKLSLTEADLSTIPLDGARFMDWADTMHLEIEKRMEGLKRPTYREVKNLEFGAGAPIGKVLPMLKAMRGGDRLRFLDTLYKLMTNKTPGPISQPPEMEALKYFEKWKKLTPEHVEYVDPEFILSAKRYFVSHVSKRDSRMRFQKSSRYSEYANEVAFSQGKTSSYIYLYRAVNNEAPFFFTGQRLFYYPHMGHSEKTVTKYFSEKIQRVLSKAGFSSIDALKESTESPLKSATMSQVDVYVRAQAKILGEERSPDGLLTEETGRSLLEPKHSKSIKHLQALGGGVTPGNLLQRKWNIPGYEISPDVWRFYGEKLDNAAFNSLAAIHMKRLIRDFEKKRPLGDQTSAWSWMMRFYARDTLGLASIFPEEALSDPTLRLKSLPYFKVSDEYFYQIADKHRGFSELLFGKGFTRETVGEKLKMWKSLEAKYETMSILFSLRNFATNVLQGSIADAAYVGARYVWDAKQLSTWQKINPEKFKSMADVRRWVYESGAIESYIVDDGNIVSRRYGAQWLKFRDALFDKLRRDPDMKDTELKELAHKYGISKAITDGSAALVRWGERITRESAFLSSYLAAKASMEPMQLEYDNPYLMKMAVQGMEGSQFLYNLSSRGAFARTNVGQVLTRYRHWGWASVKSRREIYDMAAARGFRPGSHEFERFKRRVLTDMFLLGMASLVPYSIFGAGLPPPLSYFQNFAMWIFGDSKQKKNAFNAQRNGLPVPLAPLMEIMPPLARVPKGLYDLPQTFELIYGGEVGRVGEFTSYSLFPYGRMARDVYRAYEHPERALDILLGMPLAELKHRKDN